jgi:hypothetical protein
MKVTAQLERGEMDYYASGVLDRKPMYVVATCGTTICTYVAVRGKGENKVEVNFPEMNALYRQYFNGIDLFNRDCFGPRSVQMAIRTKSWYRRYFLAMLGMCETNALNAYRTEVGPVDRYTWLVKLSHALIYNPEVTD